MGSFHGPAGPAHDPAPASSLRDAPWKVWQPVQFFIFCRVALPGHSTWQEVSARAPTYFITISEGQTLKNFQKNVFQTSSNVSAAETDNSDTLRKLARNVSELTMPALQM